MHIPSTLTLAVVAVTMCAATTAGGAVATSANAATSPVEQSAAQAFCADVNAERAARGARALHCTYNGAAQSAVESHQDRTDVWVPLANNPASATVAFMQSNAHRYSLVAANATAMDVGVSCASYQPGDGSTDFGMYVGADFDQHPTAAAPLNPIVTTSDGSTPCGARIPPPTIPPPTQPPGTLPPQHTPPAPGRSNGGGSSSPIGPSESTPGPSRTSPNSGTVSPPPPGSKSSTTSTSVPRHKALVDKGPHSPHVTSTGAPRSSITSSGSASQGGPSIWWWTLIPVGGLGIVGALLVARRMRAHSE